MLVTSASSAPPRPLGAKRRISPGKREHSEGDVTPADAPRFSNILFPATRRAVVLLRSVLTSGQGHEPLRLPLLPRRPRPLSFWVTPMCLHYEMIASSEKRLTVWPPHLPLSPPPRFAAPSESMLTSITPVVEGKSPLSPR